MSQIRIGPAFSTQEVTALTALSDVEITSPSDNDLLAYDLTSTSWINQTPNQAGLDTRYALTTLSNLASVAINTSLISDIDSIDNLGSITVAWANLYVDTISSITGNALALTPISGQSLTVNLATTGDFAVNTDDLVVDTSSGYVGLGTTAPTVGLELGSTTTGQNQIINATLGSSELAPALTTGNWTLGTGWQYLTTPNRLDKNADGTDTTTPTVAISIVAGITYKVVITVDSISGSTAGYTLGGSSGTRLAAATTYTDYITASTTGNLIITPAATGLRMTISAISIKALTDATGDLTVYGNLKVASPIQSATGINAITIGPSGNIDYIGTITPSSAITIEYPFNTSRGINIKEDYSGGVIGGGGYTSQIYTQNAHLWIKANSRINLSSGDGSNISITPGTTDKVGIGTATDATFGSKLSVNGNASIGSTYYGTAAPTDGLIVGGNVGIGTTAPTAVLHLKASTATANTASLKIDAGVVATTPVTGNIESDGTNLYWTDSGGTRRQLNNV